MKHKQMKWTAFWVGLSLLAMASRCLADDSAAAIAAGGLVARRETRIVMAREVLKISPAKVVVDYDFRNDSDEDVTTEVAFPIPPYENGPNELPAENASFSDFALIVDGKTVRYQADARAFLKGAEVTSVLRADKIDIATFGHWDWKNDRAPELARLPKLEQNRLVKAGLFDSDEPWGNWTVRLQYHWTQIFRAHSTVHIRHEYTPNYGFEMMPRATIRKALHEPPTPGDDAPQTTAADTKLLNSFCPDAGFLHSLEKGMSGPRAEDSYTHTHWIDFILTSANTWKQPIEDFTLIVERGTPLDGYEKPLKDERFLVSFCSPEHAPVQKLDADHFDADHFQVHVTNFMPKAELRIGFFDLPTAFQQPGK